MLGVTHPSQSVTLLLVSSLSIIMGCFMNCSLLVKILPSGRHLLGSVSISVG